MSEREQNKKINEHNRRITKLEAEVKSLEVCIEPEGWISEAFDAVESHLDKVDTSIRKLERQVNHNHNELSAKLDLILGHVTGIRDLPEE